MAFPTDGLIGGLNITTNSGFAVTLQSHSVQQVIVAGGRSAQFLQLIAYNLGGLGAVSGVTYIARYNNVVYIGSTSQNLQQRYAGASQISTGLSTLLGQIPNGGTLHFYVYVNGATGGSIHNPKAFESLGYSYLLGTGNFYLTNQQSPTLTYTSIPRGKKGKKLAKPHFQVLSTDTGSWLSSPGSDFVFAYVDNSWPDSFKAKIGVAFQAALNMTNTVKQAVLDTSGDKVVNGLYILNQVAMITAMNSIPGMGEQSAVQASQSGDGTSIDISAQFLRAALASVSGDITPITNYFNGEMANFQASLSQTSQLDQFGTMIAFISGIPMLGVVTTTFQYSYASSQLKEFVVELLCSSSKHYSYNYNYTVVNFNYSPQQFALFRQPKLKGNFRAFTTDSGTWLSSPGSDFVFAYVDNSWSDTFKASIGSAFQSALNMTNLVKDAVKNTSGQQVVNGLYILNQTAMTRAMNSIPGMGQQSVAQNNKSGKATAVQISGEFLAAALAGIAGDVEPIVTYFTKEMANFQVSLSQTSQIDQFGTMISFISGIPTLNVVTTTFQYSYASSQYKEWVVDLVCASSQHYEYDYGYTVVNYNYAPSLPPARTPRNALSYRVLATDSGKWLSSPGSDFVFAYVEDSWPADFIARIGDVFQSALKMTNTVKAAVLKTSGQQVVNGLYILNQAAMIKAMNSIPGMGEQSAVQASQSGNGTSIDISTKFLAAALAGISGDISPISNYFNGEMANFQASLKETSQIDQFGTMIAFISGIPVLGVVTTTFQYSFASSELKEFVVQLVCSSSKHYSYNYDYTVVNFNYSPE